MGELLMRRRGMIGGGEANHLVYSLENYVTTAGEIVRTDPPYYALAEDAAVTILLDYTLTANPATGGGRVYKMISCYNNVLARRGISVGKYSATDTTLSMWWNSANSSYTRLTGASNTGRMRIAVTHDAGSQTLYVSVKDGNGNRINNSRTTSPFTAAPTAALQFGQSSGDTGLPPNCTIHSAKVYDIVLSAEEINAFFA